MTDLAFASTGRCCLLSSSTSHTTARDMKATGLLMFALAGPDQSQEWGGLHRITADGGNDVAPAGGVGLQGTQDSEV